MKQKIEISYKTILFTVFFLLFLWFMYKISAIVILTFVALLLAVTLSPLVDRIEKFRLPRVLAIFIVYILVIGIFSIVISLIIPQLISQTSILAESLSAPVTNLPFLQFDWSTISNQLELISKNLVGVIRFLISAASNIFTLITLLVLTFYFIYEKKNLNHYLDRLFDDARKTRVSRVIDRLDSVLGGWLRGQLALMLIIGIMSYIGLVILGVKYVLPLALLAGLLEFIPNLGPTLSMIPALFAGWAISPVTALGVFILYLLIQQIENYIIVPQVMKKATGLHPLVSLLCLLIGGKLSGLVGIILAIPVFLTLKTVIEELYFKD